MRKLVLLAAFFLVASKSFAGGDLVGNGGFGVGCMERSGYQTYLLDLYEYRNDNSGKCIASENETEAQTLARARAYMSAHYTDTEVNEVFSMYDSIKDLSEFTALTLLNQKDVDGSQYKGELSAELKKINGMIPKACSLVQLGVYSDHLYISPLEFSFLSPLQRTAFFFHEAAYFYFRDFDGMDNSMYIRLLVGKAVCE